MWPQVRYSRRAPAYSPGHLGPPLRSIPHPRASVCRTPGQRQPQSMSAECILRPPPLPCTLPASPLRTRPTRPGWRVRRRHGCQPFSRRLESEGGSRCPSTLAAAVAAVSAAENQLWSGGVFAPELRVPGRVAATGAGTRRRPPQFQRYGVAVEAWLGRAPSPGRQRRPGGAIDTVMLIDCYEARLQQRLGQTASRRWWLGYPHPVLKPLAQTTQPTSALHLMRLLLGGHQEPHADRVGPSGRGKACVSCRARPAMILWRPQAADSEGLGWCTACRPPTPGWAALLANPPPPGGKPEQAMDALRTYILTAQRSLLETKPESRCPPRAANISSPGARQSTEPGRH